MLNVKDPYNMIALTGAINELPYIPHELEEWLPWNVQGEAIDKLLIEFLADGSLELIDEAARGSGKKESVDRDVRSSILIKVPYYPQWETIMAAQVQGVRAFGSDSELEGYQVKVNEALQKIKNKNALMREFIRAGALQGKILKKDGNVSQDLLALFGISKNTHQAALGTATTDVVAEIIEAKEKAEDELGQFQGLARGYKLICGKNIFRKITRHAKVEKAYEYWNSTSGMGGAARDDLRKGFPIASDVDVVSYSKGKVGSTNFLDPDTALLCPIVDGLYQTRNAPADNKWAVNTIGLPEYASSQELPLGKGDEVHGEMSTVSYVERPRAVVEFKSSN
jgi:hypothetical protein